MRATPRKELGQMTASKSDVDSRGDHDITNRPAGGVRLQNGLLTTQTTAPPADTIEPADLRNTQILVLINSQKSGTTQSGVRSTTLCARRQSAGAW